MVQVYIHVHVLRSTLWSVYTCGTAVVISKKGVSSSGDLTMKRVFCRASIWHLQFTWVYHIGLRYHFIFSRFI